MDKKNINFRLIPHRVQHVQTFKFQFSVPGLSGTEGAEKIQAGIRNFSDLPQKVQEKILAVVPYVPTRQVDDYLTILYVKKKSEKFPDIFVATIQVDLMDLAEFDGPELLPGMKFAQAGLGHKTHFVSARAVFVGTAAHKNGLLVHTKTLCGRPVELMGDDPAHFESNYCQQCLNKLETIKEWGAK